MSHRSYSNEQISYAARSDVGMKRPMNQDAYDATIAEAGEWESLGHRFVVADGMGAHAAGELASQLAVEEFERNYVSCDVSPRESLISAIQATNSTIHRRGQEDRQLYNMGTTCSALLLLPEGAMIAHVGDSRVYRVRDSSIQQLTFDHSLVWEMRAAGQVRGNSETSIPRNVITRCLGPHPDVDVDIEGAFNVSKGDAFLLCSDGLTGKISDAEIGTIVRNLEPEAAADFLIHLANLRGGSDNITVIVVRVEGDQLVAAGNIKDKSSAGMGTHPAWWFAAGGGVVMAIVCYQLAQFGLAAAGVAISIMATAGAVNQWLQNQQREGSGLPNHSPPYATSPTEMNSEFVAGICDTFRAATEYFGDEREDGPEIIAAIDAAEEEFLPEQAAEICERLANLSARLREQH